MKIRARQLASGGRLQVTLRRGAVAGYCTHHADSPHATAVQAGACWRKYLLEQTLQLDGTRGTSGPCKVCGAETNRTVVINGYPRDYWRDGHRNTEAVAEWWNAATAAQAAS